MKFFVLIFLVVFPFSLSAKAEDICSQSAEETNTEGVNIDSIEYNYTFSDGYLTCKGDLEVIVDVSDRCSKLFIYYSKPFITDIEDFKAFIAKYEFVSFEPGSKNRLVIPNIKWGTYFRVRELLDDGTNIYSPTYCTNDFIDGNDLEKILEQASVDITETDDINTTINNGHLLINTSSPVEFTIADLDGNLLYSGIVSRQTEISLAPATSPIIIIRYNIKGKIITKKFVIK